MLLPPIAAKPLLIFVFLAFVLAYERITDFLNIPRSKYTYAKVVLKEEIRGLAFNCRVTFEIGNHKIIELLIPKKAYKNISVGSRGVLVHTDSRFRGFHVDKKIPDLIKPKKNKRKKSKGWR